MAAADSSNKTRFAAELGVSRASLYYRSKMPEKDEALRRAVESVMLNNPGYGSPRVAIALKMNEKRAARIMRKFALRPARHCKTPTKLEDRGGEALHYTNILSRMTPIAPDVVWASDFLILGVNSWSRATFRISKQKNLLEFFGSPETSQINLGD